MAFRGKKSLKFCTEKINDERLHQKRNTFRHGTCSGCVCLQYFVAPVQNYLFAMPKHLKNDKETGISPVWGNIFSLIFLQSDYIMSHENGCVSCLGIFSSIS